MSQQVILIVDDDVDSRDVLSIFLEHQGYAILQAANGQEAVERAVQHRPDLILMDLMMPVLDGWGALRRLRLDPRTSRLPVVAVTALDGDLLPQIRQAGFTAHLAKPVPLQEALRAVRLGLQAAAESRSWVDLPPRDPMMPMPF